jgi:Mrp family chromosome partitioning ATPase
MARILEAQRLAETRNLHTGEPSPAAEAPNGDAENGAEQYSFIEVGGTILGIQASPDVLATPAAPARVLRSEPAPVPTLTQPEPSRPALAEAGPLFVAFQPWPTSPAAPFPELISYHQPDHPASNHYRSLLEQILGGDTAPSAQAFLLTGLCASAGTTTVLLNLAVSATLGGKRRVAVLDLNTIRPTAAKRLGLSAGMGIQEVLSGRSALEQAIQPTRVKELFVLAPAVKDNTAAVFSAEAVRWIVSWLRQRFDLIFIDSATWEGNTLLASADAVFLVAPRNGVSAPRLTNIGHAIARQGGLFRGVIQTGD